MIHCLILGNREAAAGVRNGAEVGFGETHPSDGAVIVPASSRKTLGERSLLSEYGIDQDPSDDHYCATSNSMELHKNVFRTTDLLHQCWLAHC
jgi:hypothetical protein